MTENKELDREIGELIRQKRQESALTQERLAEIVGITAAYWRSIERGQGRPSWVIMLKICAVLRINIFKIFRLYILPELKLTVATAGLKL